MNAAQYCEAMLYDYEPDWHPSGVIELDRPDVLAWRRPGRSIGHSRVAYAKWSEAVVDARRPRAAPCAARPRRAGAAAPHDRNPSAPRRLARERRAHRRGRGSRVDA